MPMKFNHLHIKARDPDKTAEWYTRAFKYEVTERVTRAAGDLFLNGMLPGGVQLIISGQKTGEALPQGSAKPSPALSTLPWTRTTSTATWRTSRQLARR